MYTLIYLEKAFGRVQGPYKGCGIVVGFGKGLFGSHNNASI